MSFIQLLTWPAPESLNQNFRQLTRKHAMVDESQGNIVRPRVETHVQCNLISPFVII
jgi:hypothetical protein